MNTLDMPRKKAGYSLDERVIAAIKMLADKTGKSANAYLEDLLFLHAKINNAIPSDAEPLGELRSGGKRTNAGRKKTSEAEEPDGDRTEHETESETD